MLEYKRNEQKAAIQRIMKMDGMENQAKMVKVIVSKIMEVRPAV